MAGWEYCVQYVWDLEGSLLKPCLSPIFDTDAWLVCNLTLTPVLDVQFQVQTALSLGGKTVYETLKQLRFNGNENASGFCSSSTCL